MNDMVDKLNSNDLAEAISAVMDVGKKYRYEYKEKVQGFLAHPESELRRAAIITLIHYLGVDGLRDPLFRLATTDPNSLVRLTAMRSWKKYCQQGGLATTFELDGLVNLLESEQDILVCIEALCCFKEFIGEPFNERYEEELRCNEEWSELLPHLDVTALRAKINN